MDGRSDLPKKQTRIRPGETETHAHQASIGAAAAAATSSTGTPGTHPAQNAWSRWDATKKHKKAPSIYLNTSKYFSKLF